MMPEPADSTRVSFLRDKTLRLCGTLEGLSRRELTQLVHTCGGRVLTDPAPDANPAPDSSPASDSAPAEPPAHVSADWLLVGASSGLQDGDAPAPWLTPELRDDLECGISRLITESQFLQRLYPAVDGEPELTALYTPQMLAELLNVTVSEVRRWIGRELIHPVREVGRLPFFDLREALGARRIAVLRRNGSDLRTLEKKIRLLQKMDPHVLSILQSSEVVISGREILLRRNGRLVEASGQMLLDFGDGDEDPDWLEAAPVPENLRDAPCREDAPELPKDTEFSFRALEAMFGDNDAPEDLGELNPEELLTAAYVLEQSGEWYAAAEMYRNCLFLFGPTADVCFRLGNALIQLGDISAARERFSMVLELDENHDAARKQLANVLEALGEPGLAAAARGVAR